MLNVLIISESQSLLNTGTEKERQQSGTQQSKQQYVFIDKQSSLLKRCFGNFSNKSLFSTKNLQYTCVANMFKITSAFSTHIKNRDKPIKPKEILRI